MYTINDFAFFFCLSCCSTSALICIRYWSSAMIKSRLFTNTTSPRRQTNANNRTPPSFIHPKTPSIFVNVKMQVPAQQCIQSCYFSLHVCMKRLASIFSPPPDSPSHTSDTVSCNPCASPPSLRAASSPPRRLRGSLHWGCRTS